VYQSLLDTLPLDNVRKLKETWTSMGDKLFPAGRQTENGRQEPGEQSDDTESNDDTARGQRAARRLRLPAGAHRV
jgi:hypothetical protein